MNANGKVEKKMSEAIIQNDHKGCNLNKYAKINKRDLWSGTKSMPRHSASTFEGMQIVMWQTNMSEKQKIHYITIWKLFVLILERSLFLPYYFCRFPVCVQKDFHLNSFLCNCVLLFEWYIRCYNILSWFFSFRFSVCGCIIFLCFVFFLWFSSFRFE